MVETDSMMLRRRLQKFLPIVLIALAVQILAPIAACWAAAGAASDPLQSVEICHSLAGAASDQGNPSGDPAVHDGACTLCCAIQAAASIDTPQQTALSIPYRHTTRVVWHDQGTGPSAFLDGAGTRARAPPTVS